MTIFNDFACNFGFKKIFFSKFFLNRKKKCQKFPKFIIMHIFGQNWRFRGISDPTHPGPKRVFVWFLRLVILSWSVGFFSHFFVIIELYCPVLRFFPQKLVEVVKKKLKSEVTGSYATSRSTFLSFLGRFLLWTEEL